MATLLEVRNLQVRYGGVAAVKELSLTVQENEIVTILGSNGAGKSSTLNAIVGAAPYQGSVFFAGCAITGWSSHRIAKQGIAMVPEGRRIFPQMTVVENLEMGAYLRSNRRDIATSLDRVFRLFPRLRDRSGQFAETMSGGEQQMLAIGRALMSKGRLLILDEPSLGLAPIVVRVITDAIREIHQKEGLAILIVEQNARMALGLANRAYVLETGMLVASGLAAEVSQSDMVRKAYLGL